MTKKSPKAGRLLPILEKRSHSALRLIHQLSQCADDLFCNAIQRSNLTPRQYTVLEEIGINDGISNTGLVEQTGIDRSTMTGIVRRLQSKKLVTRRRTKRDARLYSTTITNKGRELLNDIQPIAKDIDAEILATIPTGLGRVKTCCVSLDEEKYFTAALLASMVVKACS